MREASTLCFVLGDSRKGRTAYRQAFCTDSRSISSSSIGPPSKFAGNCHPHGAASSLPLHSGMKLTAFDEDQDDDGNRDDLIASGTVAPAPDWLRCNGSRWVLEVDENGVQHQSDVRKNA